MTRLDFVLPPFTRVIWVTEMARDIWEARLSQIVAAWIEVEWRSVGEGLRQCASVEVPLGSFGQFAMDCEKCGLIARALEINLFEPGGIFGKGDPLHAAEPRLEVLVGRREVVEAGENAWRSGDESALGRLFGYPQCCVEQFIGEGSTGCLIDPVWRAFGGMVTGGEMSFLVTGEWCRSFIVFAIGSESAALLIRHADRQCAESRRLSAALISFGRKIGRAAEMEWLLEVLSWPMEWSALHGIAELKTPVFKATMNTDATAEKYLVRNSGSRTPPEAAHGVRFPYLLRHGKADPKTANGLRFPSNTPSNTSASLQAADSVVAISNPEGEKWYYADNGFSSRATMGKRARAHCRPCVAGAFTWRKFDPRSRLREWRVAPQHMPPNAFPHSIWHRSQR